MSSKKLKTGPAVHPGWSKKDLSFEDALELNVNFLNGRSLVWYHNSPVYDMDTSNLLYINEVGKFFTCGGQSNKCEYNVHYPNGHYGSIEQKSELNGYFEESQLEPLLDFIKNNKYRESISYYFLRFKDNKAFQNFRKKTWITREMTGSYSVFKKWDESTWVKPEDQGYLFPGESPGDGSGDGIEKKSRLGLVYFCLFNNYAGASPNMENFLVDYVKLRSTTPVRRSTRLSSRAFGRKPKRKSRRRSRRRSFSARR